MVPTPLLYFSAVHLKADGAVMITGSHNPSEFNGFKTVCGPTTLHGETIQEVRRIIEARDFLHGRGSHADMDVIPAYLDEVAPQFDYSSGGSRWSWMPATEPPDPWCIACSSG